MDEHICMYHQSGCFSSELNTAVSTKGLGNDDAHLTKEQFLERVISLVVSTPARQHMGTSARQEALEKPSGAAVLHPQEVLLCRGTHTCDQEAFRKPSEKPWDARRSSSSPPWSSSPPPRSSSPPPSSSSPLPRRSSSPHLPAFKGTPGTGLASTPACLPADPRTSLDETSVSLSGNPRDQTGGITCQPPKKPQEPTWPGSPSSLPRDSFAPRLSTKIARSEALYEPRSRALYGPRSRALYEPCSRALYKDRSL